MRLPDWLGFRGKTLWDWLQLLIVPAILIAVTFAWSATQTRSDNKREDRRIAADRAAAEEARQDATLQTYLDQMSGLMLDGETADLQGRRARSGRSRAPSPSPRFAAWTESERPKSYVSCTRPGCCSGEIPGSSLRGRRPQGADLAERQPRGRRPRGRRPHGRRPRGRRPRRRRPHGRQPHGTRS